MLDSARVRSRRVTTQPAGIDPFNMLNLLAGLAWLREASIDHIHRLWFPDYSATGVRKLLRRLEADDLIERRMWALPRPRIGTPARQPTMWSLTAEGRSWLKDHDLFPPTYKVRRHRRVLSHDTMTTDAIVRMIELGRPAGLSGIYVEQELRLNPPHRRPIMDSLVILRTGGTYPFPNAVPWSSDPRMPGEKRRRYAIESDGGKETESVIAGKAQAYRAAATPAWMERYGRFPIVVWVVRTEARLQDINRIWSEMWPDGKWLLTVDSWLPDDRWVEYHGGTVRTRTLFDYAQRSTQPPP